MNVEHSKGLRDIPVKIKRLHPDAVIPKYATELAAGFDLVAVEDVIIEPQETKLIPLGFAIQLPDDTEMQIRPRSGASYKTSLVIPNSPATIDADFRGEVKVMMRNAAVTDYDHDGFVYRADSISGDPVGDTYHPFGTYLIRKGDRIAQGVIAPVVRAEFIEVDTLDETERGARGFGSTGVGTEVV